MQPKIHADFETRSAADLKKVGADKYSRHPSTEVLCMAFAFVAAGEDEPKNIYLWKHGDGITPELKRAFTFLADGCRLKSWNVAFELAIWNNVCVPKYGWPMLLPHQVECAMAEAYAMGLPGSLEKAAPAVGIADQKDMPGHRVMMQLSRPRDVTLCNCTDQYGSLADCKICGGTGHEPVWWTPETAPEKFEKLYAYCIQDLKVEIKTGSRLLPLSEAENRVWQLDYKINQRGIRVDIPAVKTALALVEFEKARLNEEMKRVTGGAVSTCTATGQLTDWVGWQLGREIDGVAKADVTELLSDSTLPDQVRRALELRREGNKSSTAKLAAMLEAASDTDQRVRGMYQYHGAGTGRWAGRRLQLHNLPRPMLKQDEIDGVFELMGVGC